MVSTSKRSIVVVVMALGLYSLAVVLQAVFWADLAAPVCDLLAAALIFHAVFSSVNKQFRLNYILAGAAILSWGIADLLWFVYSHLLFIDPDSSLLITLLYFGTNTFLVAAMIFYAYFRLRKWNAVQLVLDGIAFSLAILWLIWALFYDKTLDQLELLLNFGIVSSISIGMDVFLIIVIGIWYLSIRKGDLPIFLRILVGSVFAYAFVDLLYYNLYSRGLYISDSFLDICYLVTLVSLAVSIKLYYIKFPSAYADQNPNTNIGNSHKGLILIFCPILIVIFSKIDAADIILYSVLILVHGLASNFIQKAINDKSLLSQELDNNKMLEQLVSEKTQNLKSANDELQQRNEELEYINQHDSLTGLNNRVYFLEKLEELIKACAPNEKVLLALWNIDNLKGINDTYGHFMGDQLIIRHAQCLQKIYEGMGVLARLGGDEFAFAIKGDFPNDEFKHIAEQVIDTCNEPLQIGEYSFSITVSVGVSLFPVCATDISTLLKNADIAMHYVKETKPDRHIAFYVDIDKVMKRKYLIGSRLKTADYDQVLELHYQPQFRMSDRKLIGMEALLRWNCPELGPVSPAEFIPIAEANDMIIPIGNWVIESAVSRIAYWNRTYHTNLRMGINISPKQFDQFSTFEVLDESIKRHKAAFQWIDIEITESVALDNEDSAGIIKKHFSNKGISVSIDDFGTGYSSLGYLRILSFERLKIAKPLIDKITFDESSRKIVVSIILLAKSLDLQTIAEGVETKAQFDLLLELGCDQIQGYYLGKPMPAEAFEEKFLTAIVAD